MEMSEKQFEQLVKQYKSSIYTVCYMFTKDTDDANDLFQEVLVNLWRGINKFRNECEMGTWVYRVSLNTCISNDRKRRHIDFLPMTSEASLRAESDEDTRQIQLLHNRIHRLQPLDRALVLLWLEDLSYEEIASIVGITVKNVSVRLYRIRQELKKMSNK